jgi:hypothetical protein
MTSEFIDPPGTLVEKRTVKMRSHPNLMCLSGLVLSITIVASVSVGAEEPQTLDDIAFMVGQWVGKPGEFEMEEIWIAAKGGVMLGLHRDTAPGKKTFFEYLRIEDRDGALVYVASPRGSGAAEFSLVAIDDRGAVFENPDHDFPQRIIYRREEDRLTARIEKRGVGVGVGGLRL